MNPPEHPLFTTINISKIA